MKMRKFAFIAAFAWGLLCSASALAQWVHIPGPGIGAGVAVVLPTVTYIGTATGTRSGAVSTNTAIGIGTASANRRVIAAVMLGSSGATVSSATIGGVTATLHVQGKEATNNAAIVIISAIVTTGTTADIVVTWSSNIFANPNACVWTADNSLLTSTTPVTGSGATTVAGTSNASSSWAAKTNGFLVGGIMFNNGTTNKSVFAVTVGTIDIATGTSPALYSCWHKNGLGSGDTSNTATWSNNYTAEQADAAWF